jgi:hypothetical protein
MHIRTLIASAVLSIVALTAQATETRAEPASPESWTLLEPGLELRAFVALQPAELGDSLIRVLRIDPQHFRFRLIAASAEDKQNHSVKEWARQYNLAAAINASMFQKDNRTSVSLMRTGPYINNPRLSKDKTILVFDPADSSLPAVQILDRDCRKIDDLLPKYRTAVQSIRMVSCKGENVWAQQSRQWSAAAIGMDVAGRILFIHSRSPYTTHDLINTLLQLPLHLVSVMYTEGGAPAQLYARSGGNEYEFLGSLGLGPDEGEDAITRPVPNVIGIERIAGKP